MQASISDRDMAYDEKSEGEQDRDCKENSDGNFVRKGDDPTLLMRFQTPNHHPPFRTVIAVFDILSGRSNDTMTCAALVQG